MPLPKETVRKLNKRLAQHRGINPRLTYAFPLSRSRRMALELIDAEKPDPKKVLKLLKSRDFVERRVGVDLVNRMAINLGPSGVTTLEGISDDPLTSIRRGAIKALGYQGPNAVPILVEISKDSSWLRRQWAMNALVNRGAESVPVLEKLLDHDDNGVRRDAEKALKSLRSGGSMGERPEPIGEPPRKPARGYYGLLGGKKPLFATPHTAGLVRRITRIEEVSNALRDSAGDDFVGVTVFGSIAKGYSKPGSDLDYAVVGRAHSVMRKFEQAAKGLNLCMGQYAGEGGTVQHMFYGLFFGDRGRLREMQKELVSSMNTERWEDVRRDILNHELNLDKGLQRMRVPKEEQESIMLRALVNRIPPPLDEVQKHLGVKPRKKRSK